MSDELTKPIQLLEAQLATLETLKDNNMLLLEKTLSSSRKSGSA